MILIFCTTSLLFLLVGTLTRLLQFAKEAGCSDSWINDVNCLVTVMEDSDGDNVYNVTFSNIQPQPYYFAGLVTYDFSYQEQYPRGQPYKFYVSMRRESLEATASRTC
jgi:hypothetical protein